MSSADTSVAYDYDADNLRTKKTVTTTSGNHAHEYTTTVVAATCTEDGYTIYECSCGSFYLSDTTAARGHFIPATVCTRCGTASGHEHSFTATVVASTCSQLGYTLYTCECGHSYQGNYTARADHYFTTAAVCSRCGSSRGEEVESGTAVCEYNYIYSGSALVQMTVSTSTDSGTPETETLTFRYDANGSPMAVSYNNATYYYVTNTQGDVTAILNTSGTAVVKYTYDAWGSILRIDDTTSFSLGTLNPLRYRGYVYDSETRLYYLQSRYYNPEMGRFINADEYTSTGQGVLSNNMFAYCGNNPITRIDHTGNAWITVGVCLLSGVASGVSSHLSGGSFIAGFAAGIVGGLIGYKLAALNTANALLQVGARMVSSIISNYGTMLLNGDELTVESIGANLFDVTMDGMFSTIIYYYNSLPVGWAIDILNALLDGFVDVSETVLFGQSSNKTSNNVSTVSNTRNYDHLTFMERRLSGG